MIEYLYSDRVWLGGKLRPASIGIRNGMIHSVEEQLRPGARDYSGSIIMPA